LSALNLHHLHYFWAVARVGSLTGAAARLRVAPSAVSAQLRLLEAQLGQELFAREGRGLVLTEAGKIALAYAEVIFSASGELVSTLQEGRGRGQVLRVGAVATLSRNFQRSFLRPLLQQSEVRLHLASGSLQELLEQLQAHALDVVLSNEPATAGVERPLRSVQLARQPVNLVCSRPVPDFAFPGSLSVHRIILPSPASALRAAFDALCERARVRARVLAEVDDMATLRLLARDTDALVLAPSVVVRDELRQGLIHEVCTVPELFESFYAITLERHFPHPLLGALLEREEGELLGG
jgi:LysR family transcriptional activator of nhaA